MAAAGLKTGYFDPIISEEKPKLLVPRHVASKIGEKRSWIRFFNHDSFYPTKKQFINYSPDSHQNRPPRLPAYPVSST